ncbi:MAG TPA: hypothetical protein VFS43_19205 [Polyangiaceae bacterium]|nr:hypothetical protein [Polyangiaceae bacterium]
MTAVGLAVAYAAGCGRARERGGGGTGAAALPTQAEVGVTDTQPGGPPGPPPGPALPPCNVQNDAQGPLVSSPAPGVMNVNLAMTQWVLGRCGPGFMPTPRDVTCSFKTKITDPKAGAIRYMPADWSMPENGEYERWLGGSKEYFDAEGKSLGKKAFGPSNPPTEGHRGRYYCMLACQGKLSATIATAEVVGGSAHGVPPGYIPPPFDVPPGKSFCDEYQKQLGLNGADCNVGNAQTEWSVNLSGGEGMATPWKQTDRKGSGQYESRCYFSDEQDYPGCAKVVTKYDYEIWTLDPSEMQKACDDLLESNAPSEAAKDQLCGDKLERTIFRSVVPAAICIPQPEAEVDDNE